MKLLFMFGSESLFFFFMKESFSSNYNVGYMKYPKLSIDTKPGSPSLPYKDFEWLGVTWNCLWTEGHRPPWEFYGMFKYIFKLYCYIVSKTPTHIYPAKQTLLHKNCTLNYNIIINGKDNMHLRIKTCDQAQLLHALKYAIWNSLQKLRTKHNWYNDFNIGWRHYTHI
jgi:hypothetical protein